MDKKRVPSLFHSLAVAKSIKPDAFSKIIDIGAQTQTDFLMKTFPDAYHFLFEPASVYHEALSKRYKDLAIKHEIINSPLSSSKKKMFLHKLSSDGSGNITHNQLRLETFETMNGLVEIEEMESLVLDDFATAHADLLLPHHYLVKLDVDGHEEEIVKGGVSTISNASFVVLEASLNRNELASRISMISDLGFRLYDICDPGYYYGQLSIVDLVFINNDVRDSEVKFRPWDYAGGIVRWDKWQHKLDGYDAPYSVVFE